MKIDAVADGLLQRAVAAQQSSLRVGPNDPISALRRAIRAQARRQNVRIRTGMIDDVLVVVRVDADVWHESPAQMKAKLIPGDRPDDLDA